MDYVTDFILGSYSCVSEIQLFSLSHLTHCRVMVTICTSYFIAE
jgi:hypothetical protein